MTAETVRTFCNTLESEVIAFTQELVRIKCYTHNEEDIVRFISRKLKSLGYDEVILDDFGNMAGRIGNGDTTIFFDSQCDTVAVNDPDEWITDPFGVEPDALGLFLILVMIYYPGGAVQLYYILVKWLKKLGSRETFLQGENKRGGSLMLKLPLATRTCTTASLLVHEKNSHLSSLLSIFSASNLLSLNKVRSR